MKTTARKKKTEAGVMTAAGAALLATAFANWPQSKGVVFWAALIGLGVLIAAAIGLREADCPTCGKAVNFAAEAGFLRCPHCRRYAKTRSDGLEGVADDFVAAAPVFGIPVSEGMIMPDQCCVCRAPATRLTMQTCKMGDSLPSKTLAEGLKKNAALGAGLRPTMEISIGVPHCEAHPADALIEMDRPPEGLFDGPAVMPVLRVRSYPYYRAAVGL